MKRRPTLVATAFFAILATSCANAPHAGPAMGPSRHSNTQPRSARLGEPTRADRLALFDTLVDEIHLHHQFADAAFARRYGLQESDGLARERWDADLPLFRRRFGDATTKERLVVALMQLNASLLDGHCRFDAQDLPPARLLPISFRPLLDGTYTRIVVRASHHEGISPGDELVSFDGIPISELFAHEMFRTSATSARGRADEIAAALSQGLMTMPSTQTKVHLVVSRESKMIEHDVMLESASREETFIDTDDGLPAQHCPAGDLDYGHGYTLRSVGQNFCLYGSGDGAFRDLPIVRYFSFMYDGRDPMGAIAADHDHLDQSLSCAHAVVPLRGIVLDVRENHGGVNPYIFLDFFATRPYPHHIVEVPLSRRLDASRVRELFGAEQASEYRARLDALAPSDAPSWRFPFLAAPEMMHAQHAPLRTLAVVRANTPVALLTSSGCASSCDTLASWFAHERIGPVLGEEPALAFTTVRLPIDVAVAGWGQLGSFCVAFSRETVGFDGPTVEGRVFPIQLIRETEENRAMYSTLLIDHASRALPTRARASRRH